MRTLLQLPLLLTLLMPAYLWSQDTLRSRIDTTICSFSDTESYIMAPYEFATYNFQWIDMKLNTLISDEDSIAIQDIDSVLLVSTSIDQSLEVLVDTIYFTHRIFPELFFEVPDLTCFNGDSLAIKDNSIYNDEYTTFDYSTSDGSGITYIDSIVKVFVGNGDSLMLMANYTVQGCSQNIDASIQLTTLFTPISEFSSDTICFGDSTTITNNAIFDPQIANFSLNVENLISFDNTADQFSVFLPENNESRNVFVEIQQGICSTKDTFIISNKLQPTANFELMKTCENEKLQILNQCTDTTSMASYSFDINQENYFYLPMNTFTLNDTIPQGNYLLEGIVSNGNGCEDNYAAIIDIDSITYVSFDHLEEVYCERQDESLLIANVSPGNYSSSIEEFITDFGDGTAKFAPTAPAESVEVIFTYTNTLACTDIDTQVVSIVHAKPDLELINPPSEYCGLDNSDTLTINLDNPDNSIYELTLDGSFYDSHVGIEYIFAPDLFGTYNIQNIYTNNQGCIDTVNNEIKVFELPDVDIASMLIIEPGETITIGYTAGGDPNMDYLWSNGSDLPYLEISHPGIYTLTGINNTTDCEATDTAHVAYDPSIEAALLDLKIAPNPVTNQVTISLGKIVEDIRLINVFGEQISLNGTSRFKTNELGQLTLNMVDQPTGYYYLQIPQIGNFLLVKI